MRNRVWIVALACAPLPGCDPGGRATPATEKHDQDSAAGHMNHPAAGPNSPQAKADTRSKK
jgi:hypothetical protein